ncbi:MAG: nucleotidyltransferase family protein [Armatimonadota bacterium]
MMTLEEVRKRIRACEQELYRLYKARVIGIFGSYARGTPREDSDVDILVEFESGASLFDLGGAQAMLSEVLDMPVDVVPREDLRPELRARIEREVVPL